MEEHLNAKFITPDIKGKVTIQLFDKENKCIDKRVKHNCVSKIPYSYAYQLMIQEAFSNCLDRKYINGDYSEIGNKSVYEVLPSYTNSIVLTYYDNKSSVDDIYNPIMRGKRIGWADRWNTYSGDDTLRGTINLKESQNSKIYENESVYISKIKNHMVFDFPTHCANGTFNNIYLNNFAYQQSIEKGAGKNKVELPFVYNSQDNEKYKGCYKNVKMSICNSKNQIYMYDTAYAKYIDENYRYNFIPNEEKKMIIFNVEDGTYEEVELLNKYDHVVYAMGFLWGINNDWTTWKLDLQGNVLKTISIKDQFSNSPNNSTSGTGFMGDDKGLYLLYCSNQKWYYTRFNSDGIKQCEIELPANNVDTGIINYIDNGGIVQMLVYTEKVNLYTGSSSKNLCLIENDKIVDYDYLSSGREGHNVQFVYFAGKAVMSFLYANMSSSEGNNGTFLYDLYPWGTHLVLDNPVTKTAANTMKIQYDLTIDYVYPFDPRSVKKDESNNA